MQCVQPCQFEHGLGLGGLTDFALLGLGGDEFAADQVIEQLRFLLVRGFAGRLAGNALHVIVEGIAADGLAVDDRYRCAGRRCG